MLISLGMNSPDEALSYFADIWIIFDVLIIFALAFFIWRKSRVAAALMLIYFVISKIIMGLETGAVKGIFISLLFLWFFVQAFRGTIVWHRLEKAENPNYKKTKSWMIWLGGVFAVIILAIMGIGLAVTIGMIPETSVQTGQDLTDYQRNKLLEADIIEPGETVKYYYSDALWNVSSSGTVMTDKRIIGYWTEDDKPRVQILAYDLNNIDYLQLTEEGGPLTDSLYQVTVRGNDESSLIMILSIEADQHLDMIAALNDHIAQNEKRWATDVD